MAVTKAWRINELGLTHTMCIDEHRLVYSRIQSCNVISIQAFYFQPFSPSSLAQPPFPNLTTTLGSTSPTSSSPTAFGKSLYIFVSNAFLVVWHSHPPGRLIATVLTQFVKQIWSDYDIFCARTPRFVNPPKVTRYASLFVYHLYIDLYIDLYIVNLGQGEKPGILPALPVIRGCNRGNPHHH